MERGVFEVGAKLLPAARPTADAAAPARVGPLSASLPTSGHEWRATGLEPAVFADPSGQRARTMSGVGLGLVVITLAALAIVVTAMVGFTRLPVSGLPVRGAIVASPHRHALLVAGVRTDARDHPAVVRGIAAPRDVDRPARVRD